MNPTKLQNLISEARSTLFGTALATAPEPSLTRKSETLPNPMVKPYQPFASSEAVQASKKLSKGGQRLWELLHTLATSTALEKGYSKHVSQVVYPLPQSLVAMALGYTARHIRNLQTELEFSGLIDSSPLAAKVEGQSLWSTTLFAVKVATTANTPHLYAEEFEHSAGHRNFEADLKAGNTVLALKKKISGLQPSEEVDWLYILRNAISVKRFELLKPRYAFSPEQRLGTLRDGVYRLTLLAEIGPETSKTVEHLASAFSRAFGDEQSFLWWAKQFWSIVGSWERIGTLQDQLNRVLADMQEFSGLKNPAAWFNKRLTT